MAGTLVLGVDGGNTKTVALVATLAGAVRGAGRAGCADLYNAASPAAAVRAVLEASEAALAAAGGAPADLAAATFSLAGADWPEDFAYLERRLRRRLGRGPRLEIVNDSIGAIRGGTPDGVGVAAVCGTYNAVGARGRDRSVFHLGFWPDGAGAMLLGRDGLRAVYRADLGLAPPTALTVRALGEYGADTPLGLLHEFTRRGGLPAGAEARFAAAVLDEAAAGDEVALAIVTAQARTLAGQAGVAADRVGLSPPYPLVLAGGVFRHPSGLLARLVAEALPDATAVPTAVEPAAAALLSALDAAGAGPEADERARASLPAAELFATR
jgi:N-acetylglucosamine kinase-like BadF-type ATPase